MFADKMVVRLIFISRIIFTVFHASQTDSQVTQASSPLLISPRSLS